MSTRPDMPEDLEDLAGEYVLGTLSAEARRHVQARLAQDAELRAAVARWEARLHPLTGLAEPVTPSPVLWRRIAATLGHAPAPSRPRRGLALWSSLAFWRGLSAAGIASAAMLAAVLLTRPLPVEYVVVLVTPGSANPGWVVQAAGPGIVELVPLAPVSVPQGQALEFWTKADDWAAPVSLGLVQPGQSLRVPLRDLPPLEANQLFELTLEPATGSPIGLPTGPIQAIGRAVRM